MGFFNSSYDERQKRYEREQARLEQEAASAEKEMQHYKRTNQYKDKIAEARKERWRRSAAGKTINVLGDAIVGVGSVADSITKDALSNSRTRPTRTSKSKKKGKRGLRGTDSLNVFGGGWF
jgi:uncharacterized protein (DUF3084 family)